MFSKPMEPIVVLNVLQDMILKILKDSRKLFETMNK